MARTNGSAPAPSYGLDLQGPVIASFIAGLAFIAMAVRLWYGLQPLSDPGRWLVNGLAIYGLASLVFAAVVTWYSRVGKVRLRDRALDRLPWTGRERVLDVGCGRGLWLVGAARRLGSGGQATGLDMWREDLGSGPGRRFTLRNARREGVADRVEVVDGDLSEMPFPDAHFDVVVSAFVIRHLLPDERRNGFSEMARVLAPGGRLMLLDRDLGDSAAALRARGLDVREESRIFGLFALLVAVRPAARVGPESPDAGPGAAAS